MAIQLSPGVNVSEVDLTTIVPSVSTSAGAFAGNFVWGPVNKRVLIPDEITLVNTFGEPDSNTYVSFFTCASFLAYGNNLTIVRAANTNSFNADGNSSPFGISIQIQNQDIYEASYLNQNNNNLYGPFVARYPGALGNSLTVSVLDSGVVQANGVPYSNNFTSWAYAGSFNTAPNTSVQAVLAGGSYDEMHIAVIDSGGLFTGTKGTVLEIYPYVSKAYDSVNPLGNSNYYKNVILTNSQYVYAIDPVNYSSTYLSWGGLSGSNFVLTSGPVTTALTGGSDASIQQADILNAYSKLASKEDVNIDLIFTGDGGVAGSGGSISSPVTTQQYAINSIAYSRADCVAFVSPPSSSVINVPNQESGLITNWYNSLGIAPTPGSYSFSDSGWKYMFDKYNNVYRWVPLNGDTAGLCVYTDQVRDAWWSPAGFNRGAIKNAVKLAWNPNKT